MTTTCSHCRHWLRQINDFGQCRRFPPQFSDGRSSWPSSMASDRCGEFDAASDDELRHLYSWAVAQTDLMPELGPPMGSAFTGEGYVTISGEGATIQEAIADWRTAFNDYLAAIEPRPRRLIWRIPPSLEDNSPVSDHRVRARLLLTALADDPKIVKQWNDMKETEG